MLLIEDDEDDFILVRDLLSEVEDARYTLLWATTFNEGLAQLFNDQVDICLLDYRLGAYTGLDLLREAMRKGCRVPIIFLTGQTEREVDLEAMRSGAVDYLVKDELRTTSIERAIRYAIERAATTAELEQLAVDLREARNKALEASQAKSELIAWISHDLRTPLTAILGYSDLLGGELRRLKLEDLANDASKISKSGHYLLSLIKELLDFSKAEAGKLMPEVSEFHLEPLLRDVIATMQPLIDENHNQFEFHCTVSKAEMRSDPARLQQILYNLLGNACKFTRYGRIRVCVSDALPPGSASMQSKADGGEQCINAESSKHPVAVPSTSWIELTVEDSGIGMSQEQMHRMFRSYEQAHAGIARKFGGSGLGLAISQQLVQILGGEISAVSTEGVGSRFSVLLPQTLPYSKIDMQLRGSDSDGDDGQNVAPE